MTDADEVPDDAPVEVEVYLAFLVVAFLVREKRYEDAKPMLEELLRVAPDEGPAHLTLGLIAHKLNEPEARTKALKAFLDLVPNSPHRAKLLELITGGKAEEGDGVVGAE